MAYMTIELADGREWACEASRGASYGEGIFARRADGTWRQHAGHGQTPAFHSPQSLSRYVHARYRDHMGERLPRMLSSRGWPEVQS